MTEPITSFNLALQTHMKDAQNRIEAFNAAAKSSAKHAETEIRRQVDLLEKQAHDGQAAFETASAQFRKWAADPSAVVAEWKKNFDIAHLTARADRAEHYAKAASEIALSSVSNAERAALDAKQARSDADAAKTHKAA
jgi:hypothetical protein